MKLLILLYEIWKVVLLKRNVDNQVPWIICYLASNDKSKGSYFLQLLKLKKMITPICNSKRHLSYLASRKQSALSFKLGCKLTDLYGSVVYLGGFPFMACLVKCDRNNV